MLDTTFLRPKGDIGNPETYPFPVEYEVVTKATIHRVVKMGDNALIESFIRSAKILQNKGVSVITTSCGFLALFQKEIQSNLSVPFYASSLIQIPLVSMLVGGPLGVITASKSNLTIKHFEGAGSDQIPVFIEGMDEMPWFTKGIVDESIELNVDAVRSEIKQVTSLLIEGNPQIKAIILECTNMPPYKNAMREITNKPIFDINTLTTYVMNGL